MEPIRVLLADDHTLVRQSLKRSLEACRGIEVVAEAADGEEAFRRIAETRPDIVLTDHVMPRMTGVDLTARVTEAWPRIRVVLLSGVFDERSVLDALRAGAAGVIMKDASLDELESALRAVARGENYLGPWASRVVAEHVRNTGRNGTDPLAHLTPRHRQIFDLISGGHTVKEIAHELNLSDKTVYTLRAQLIGRLHLSSTMELLRCAIEAGLTGSHR